MNSDKAREILGISFATLRKLRESGRLPAIKLPTGAYEYDEDEVYTYMSKGNQSENQGIYLYARVSADDTDENLLSQIQGLKDFALENFIQVSGEFHEKATDFKDRCVFMRILFLAESGKLKKLLVKNPLILGETELFQKFLSDKFGVSVVFVDEDSLSKSGENLVSEGKRFLDAFSKDSPVAFKRIASDVFDFSRERE